MNSMNSMDTQYAMGRAVAPDVEVGRTAPDLALCVKRMESVGASMEHALERLTAVADRLGANYVPQPVEHVDDGAPDRRPGLISEINARIEAFDRLATAAHTLARRLESAA